MMVPKNLFVLLILNLWTALCHARFSVWRADTRTPTEMRAAGLFSPRGATRILQVTQNISMYNHALGAPSGASQDNDGYVSTTASESTAVRFLSQFFSGNGYIYEIAASANFIQVAGTLGQFSPYPDELEYAALGGFGWDQVVRWTRYVNGVPDSAGLQDNNEYEVHIYGNLAPSNGEPSLAGFPNGHQAWGLPPWNTYAQDGCGSSGGRSLHSRQKTPACNPKDTAFDVARKYIDDTCLTQNLCG